MKISMIPNKIVKLIHASKGDTSLRKWAFEPYDNNGAINVSNIKDQLVYKTENGGTEQLLPVNTSTPTTSYFDGTINYGTDTDVEFTYKQSSYTGQARIKSIKGNTLCWNQLVQNGNFADNTKWAVVSSATINSVANNTINVTTVSTAQSGISNPNVDMINGHKYLLTGTVKTTGQTYISISGVGSILFTENSFNTKSNIFTWSSATQTWAVMIRNWDANSATFEAKNIMLFDLTAMGLDTLTVDQFKSLFPLNYYAYNSGSLLNFNGTGIKTTGKNQLDTFVFSESSAYTVNDDGTLTVNSSDPRAWTTVNTFRLKKGNYIFTRSVPNGVCDIRFGYEDFATNHLIANQLASFSFTVEQDTDVKIKIGYSYSSYPFTTNAMIRFADMDETFEPYTSSTLSLPISTYFTNGMKSAGSVYDELSDKAITRVGSVDLGSLEWEALTTSGSEYRMSTLSAIDNIKKPSASSGVANVVCSEYTTTSSDSVYLRSRGISITTTGKVSIYDPSYNTSSSASAFKTAMSGVYLNFELATYTETDIQNASLVCKNIEVPCYLSNGNLVCDATEELTNESGFFDAKLKIKDSSSVAYSSKFKLHVEDL